MNDRKARQKAYFACMYADNDKKEVKIKTKHIKKPSKNAIEE